jgi:hypothetical protein
MARVTVKDLPALGIGIEFAAIVSGRPVLDRKLLNAEGSERGQGDGAVEKDAAGQRSILAQKHRYAWLVKVRALQLARGAR